IGQRVYPGYPFSSPLRAPSPRDSEISNNLPVPLLSIPTIAAVDCKFQRRRMPLLHKHNSHHAVGQAVYFNIAAAEIDVPSFNCNGTSLSRSTYRPPPVFSRRSTHIDSAGGNPFS